MSEKSLRRAMLFGLGGGFLAAISRLNVLDLDLFHEMALIREAFRLGFLPRTDTFSYVPTISPVVHHEWGTGLILYLVTVQLGLGAAGLMVLKYLLTAFIALGCYFFATRQGASYPVFSFLGLLGIMMGLAGFSTIRAQLFTLCFTIILLFLVEEDRKGKGWALWAWLPVYLIWLNLHGGFLVGVVLLAVYISERFFMNFFAGKNFLKSLQMVKRPILFWVATCLLTLVTPYGTAYLPYIWNAVTLDRTPYIVEWRPLWEINLGDLLAWIFSVGVVLYCTTQKSLRQMPGLFIVAATAWVSLWHYRHLSIYAVVWICYTPAYVENTSFGNLINKVCKQNARLLTAIFVIIGLAGTVYAVRHQFWQLRIPTTAEDSKEGVPVYPAGAVSYLKDHQFSGNLMVPFDAGAYVSWKLYPEVKVSMDSRFEVVYPVQAVRENILFYAAEEGWQKTLTKYQTDAILVPRWRQLDQVMGQNAVGISNGNSPGWTLVYQDDGYSLYLRSDLAKRFPITDMRGKPITAHFP
ncbi:MAG: hypothetical protein ACLPT6_11200 [Desulfobaccales bacterium]